MNKWGKVEKTNVVKMPSSTLQASIVLGFDVPTRNRKMAESELETLMQLAVSAVRSVMQNSNRAGVDLVDMRVDWD